MEEIILNISKDAWFFSELLIYLLIIVLCGISYILTSLVIRYALKKSILDIPNQRSSHSTPTPTGGGISIVITWYSGILLLFLFKQIDRQLVLALLPGLIIAIISLIDDLFEVKPIIRLVAQATALALSLWVLKGFISIEFAGIEFHSELFSILFLIGGLWFINLFNFLDGINGYASFEAIFIALSMFVFLNDMVFLVLIAVVVGFLLLNFPKAKVFMGDIGSTQLGFILVVLGLYFHNDGRFSIFLWLILSSLFWMDATLTLFRRFRKKEKIGEAHKKHAYQRIVQSGFTHTKAVLFSIGLNIILFVMVIAGFYLPRIIPFIILVDIGFLYLIIRRIDLKKPFV